METKDVNEKDVPLDGSSTVEEITEEQQGSSADSEPPYEVDGTLIAMTEHYEHVQLQLDNMTNLLIVCVVGIGIVVGAISCSVFSRFLKQ